MRSKYFVIVFFALFAISLLAPASYAKDKFELRIIAVQIGAKSPNFSEERYPHIKFLYTPELTVRPEDPNAEKVVNAASLGLAEKPVRFNGQPEFLAKLSDSDWDIRKLIFVTDGIGTVAWAGTDKFEKLSDCYNASIKQNLEEAIKVTFKKGKPAEINQKKSLDLTKVEDLKGDFALNIKMPAMTLSDIKGEKVELSSLVENGTPALIFFFTVPETLNLDKTPDGSGAASPKDFMKAMQEAAKLGAEQKKHLLYRIENQFFNHDPYKAKK